MPHFADADFYTDASVATQPHEYFRHLRDKGPIVPLPRPRAMAVTGYDEAVQIVLDTEHFSSANATNGPLARLPFEPQGDDIRAERVGARAQGAFDDVIATTEGERHIALRSLLSRLFTPSRLKAVDADLVGTADGLIDEFIGDGRFDLVRQYGRPFTTLVIADLLGIPPDGRRLFRDYLKNNIPAEIGAPAANLSEHGIAKIGAHIYGYLAERRQNPQQDILTDLALARYPDGSEPALQDLAALGAFLFGAGQDTTNHLIGNGMRILATQPELQEQLRDDLSLIPDFVEEVLRFDGSVMAEGRLCVKTTTVGGVEIKAGTSLTIALMGANRDERRFEDADTFKLGRPKAKEHLAFGRGAHTCIGAPLARSEARVSFERLLSRLRNIRVSPAHHGTAGNYRFDYEPTYILRALKHLHLEFDAA